MDNDDDKSGNEDDDEEDEPDDDDNKDEYNDNKEGGLTKEIINELMEGVNITDKIKMEYKLEEGKLETKNKNNMKEDTISRIELESIISQKSEDIRRYILNAERARRASDMLHQKAKYAGEELKRYRTQIQQLDN